MSQIVIYNWTPWKTYVQVNGLQNTPWSPLEPSTGKYNYCPYFRQLPRDLTYDHGIDNLWGKINNLTIRWEEIADALIFPGIRDPPDALNDVDLLLWIFPYRVILSQLSIALEEVYPAKN